MPFVITSPCLGTQDRACVEACPVDCIHFEAGVDAMLYINPADCIDCGACQPECPVSAIFPLAEVPADQQKFVGINALWYEDPAGARAQIGSDIAPAVTAEMVAAEAAAGGGGGGAAGEEALPYSQVGATTGPAPAVHHAGRSPVGVIALGLFAALFVLMVIFPGPVSGNVMGIGWDISKATGPGWSLDGINGVPWGITVVLLTPVLVLLLAIFIVSQWSAISTYAASRPRPVGKWRARAVEWRRSEDSRRADLAGIVNSIAADRFAYPNDEHPNFRTYVNLPEPTMAIEVQGGADKLLPDIVVLDKPGGRPKIVAQVESRETLTREQAEYVWSQLQFADAPLLLYVPAGLGGQAKDYARAAGIKHAQIRTWRRQPNGVRVREIR